ncbi:MAG: hypothetical protein ACOZAL_00905 [Patescibacteria group bacterium]
MTWEIICSCGDHIVFEKCNQVKCCLGCDRYFYSLGFQDCDGKQLFCIVEILIAEEKVGV